ncbi:TRAP transporter permease [Alkalihalobacterium sp. APHAB7]|uniref:TRAP transporter permease n=1 Tax=Alkalihalobacterium sp. APHAB7 TaxID=3402081 RepID=UPI003AAE558E
MTKVNEFNDNELESFTTKKHRKFKGFLAFLVSTIAICWALFHLYTSYFGSIHVLIHRSIHLTLALTLVFILVPASIKFKESKWGFIIDLILALGSISIGIYVYFNADVLTNRAGLPIITDYIFGGLAILLILEATRRVFGWVLPVVAVFLLIYAYTGHHWPLMFSHAGNDLDQIISYLFLSLNGIYGVALGISATLIVIFIMLSYFLIASGAAKFFMDLATALIGWVRGGPAKMAVISSAFFGSITGSPAANVVSTGSVTIRMMKGLGYRPHFAGGVEAAASTGGQFMPPIMGATAFVMAEVMGVPYREVVIAAIIPAFLYFSALLIMVDIESVRNQLKGVAKKQLPSLIKVLKEGWFHALPLLLLLYLLVIVGYSPVRAGFFAIVSIIIINIFSKSNRFTVKRFLKILERSSYTTMEIAAACATAGIIMGTFSITGFGPRLSSILVDLSQGYLLPLLLMTMIASIIMGMALPTIITYMVLSVLVAPTLINMGIEPMAAHMFVLFFGVLSYVTPPIAFAAYAGAAIAGANPMKTAITSSKLAISAFILPFMFVYSPELLLIGEKKDIVLAIFSALIGITAISMAVQGFVFKQINIWKRLLLFSTGILLVYSNILTDILGYGLFTIIVLSEYIIVQKSSNKLNIE